MRSLNNISKNKSSMVFNYEDIYCCFVFIVIYLKSIFSSFADQIYNIFLTVFIINRRKFSSASAELAGLINLFYSFF